MVHEWARTKMAEWPEQAASSGLARGRCRLLARRATWAWSARCLGLRMEVVERRADLLCSHLSKVRRAAGAVRDHNQRVVAMAVFEVWVQMLPSASGAAARAAARPRGPSRRVGGS